MVQGPVFRQAAFSAPWGAERGQELTAIASLQPIIAPAPHPLVFSSAGQPLTATAWPAAAGGPAYTSKADPGAGQGVAEAAGCPPRNVYPWSYTVGGDGGSGGDASANKIPAHGYAGASASAVTWRRSSSRGGDGGDGSSETPQQIVQPSTSGNAASSGKWEAATPWPDSCPGKRDQMAMCSGSGGGTFRSGWTNGTQLSTAGQPTNGPGPAADARVLQDASSQEQPWQPWSNMAGGFTSREGCTNPGGGTPEVSSRAFVRRWGDRMDEQPPMPPAAAGATMVRSTSPRLAAGEGWRMLI